MLWAQWRDEGYSLVKIPLPQESPDLRTFVRAVAYLSGFPRRRHDNEPGVTTIWCGISASTASPPATWLAGKVQMPVGEAGLRPRVR